MSWSILFPIISCFLTPTFHIVLLLTIRIIDHSTLWDIKSQFLLTVFSTMNPPQKKNICYLQWGVSENRGPSTHPILIIYSTTLTIFRGSVILRNDHWLASEIKPELFRSCFSCTATFLSGRHGPRAASRKLAIPTLNGWTAWWGRSVWNGSCFKVRSAPQKLRCGDNLIGLNQLVTGDQWWWCCYWLKLKLKGRAY